MCFLIPSNIPSVHFLKGPFFIWFVYSNKAYILHWVDRSPKPLLICRLSLPLFIPYNLSVEEIGSACPKAPQSLDFADSVFSMSPDTQLRHMLPASLSDPQWCWSFHQQALEGSPQGQHHWWAPSGSSFISVYKVVTANSISPPLHNHTVTVQNNSYAKTWQCLILSLYYFPEKWVSSLSILQRSA